jgi:hypothetical protein
VKDQLVSMVAQKVGISAEQADQAVDTVLGYIKDNPEQLQGMLNLDDSMMAGLKDKLGGMFKR